MAGKYQINEQVTVEAPGGAWINGVIEDSAWEPDGRKYAVRSEAWRVKKWFAEDEINPQEDADE